MPILGNIIRVLGSIDWRLVDSLHLANCRQEPDRIIVWPKNDDLLKHMIRHRWNSDPAWVAQHFHGTDFAFRERVVEPALQVAVHWSEDPKEPLGYYLEIDLDLHNVYSDPVGHGAEVLGNLVHRRKTDQDQMEQAVERRLQLIARSRDERPSHS